MKRFTWFLLLLIVMFVTGCATVPVNEEEVPVNVELMQEFYTNLDVAQWLAWYDYIAWVSSDFITQLDDEKFQLLGEEWFVYQTDDGPRAAFGKYHPDSDVFETIYHLNVNGLDDIVLLDSEVESELGSQLA